MPGLRRSDRDAGSPDSIAGTTPGAAGSSGRADGEDANGGTGGSAGDIAASVSSCNTWGPFAAPEPVTGLGPDTYLKPAPSADGSELLVTRSNNGQAEILRATRQGRGAAFSRATALPY